MLAEKKIQMLRLPQQNIKKQQNKKKCACFSLQIVKQGIFCER